MLSSGSQANIMKCFARLPFTRWRSFRVFLNKVWKEEKKGGRVGKGQPTKGGGGKRRRPFRLSQVSVSSYNWWSVSGNISWPGNATTFLAEWRHCWPVNYVEYLHINIHTYGHTDSLGTRLSGLILCERQNVCEVKCECDTSVIFHTLLLLLKAVENCSVTVGKLPAVHLQVINRFNMLTACDRWPEVHFHGPTNL